MPILKKIFGCIALVVLLPLSSVAQNAEPLFSATAAAKKHGVFRFESFQQLTTKAKTLDKLGMRLTDFEIHSEGSQLHFSGVFQPGARKY